MAVVGIDTIPHDKLNRELSVDHFLDDKHFYRNQVKAISDLAPGHSTTTCCTVHLATVNGKRGDIQTLGSPSHATCA